MTSVSVDAPAYATVDTHETWYAEIYDIGSGKLIQRTPPATYDETYGLEYQNDGWIVTRNDLS